jgi:hypothetical protein
VPGAAITIGAATAAPRCSLIVLPIWIRDARAALCSEGLTVGGKGRQHAGEGKCHNAHRDSLLWQAYSGWEIFI